VIVRHPLPTLGRMDSNLKADLPEESSLDTRLAQAGSRWDVRTGGISMPIHLAATFRHPGLGRTTGWDYSRSGNPTGQGLEDLLASIEGATRAFAFASGMAAVDAVLRLLAPGSRIVVPEEIYGGTWRILERVGEPWGLQVRWVSFRDLAERPDSLLEGADMVLFETPTNPTLLDADPTAVLAAARRAGCLSVVDATFLTPVLLRPLELGADLVVHSGTKYLSGHSDLTAGVVATRDRGLADRIGYLRNTTGAVLSPFDSWLLLRGLKTLSLRVRRQQDTARTLASALPGLPGIVRVAYPGRGGMVAFEVDSAGRVETLLERVRVWIFAESLGGTESLVTVPASQTHADVDAAVRERLGITDRLVRLSVGLEDPADLIEDLRSALGAAP